MTLRFSEICVDAHDAGALAAWWSRVLGWPAEEDDDGDFVMHPPAGAGPDWLFIPVPDGKVVKNRIHLDIEPVEGTRDDELARLLAHGAVEVSDHRGQYGPGTGWVVLADPEGNEFCVLRSRSVAP